MPLPHDGEIVVVVVVVVLVVVVLPGVVVVVVPDPWTSTATSATKASTLASMAAASPFVEHVPLLSAFANADVKRVSAFARHSPSTAPPFAAAFATHLAFAAHFLPVAVSFEALQVFPCAATGVLVIASTQSVAKTELAGALTMAIPPSAVVWSRQPQAFRLSGASSPSSRPRPSSSPYVPGGRSIMPGSRVGADALNRLIPRRRLDCTSPASPPVLHEAEPAQFSVLFAIGSFTRPAAGCRASYE